MIKLVLTDIDNTLIPLGADGATDHAMRAIHALLDAGVEFGPATGRDIDGMERFFHGDEACWSTSLISNGKLIFRHGELVKLTCLDHDAVQRLCDFVCPLADSMVLIRSDNRDLLLGATPDLVEKCIWVLGPDIPLIGELPDTPVTACTITCVGDAERNAWLISRVEEICPGLECLSPVPGCYDVVPRGWNKATALAELMRIMGVSPEEVVVFGDSENDVPILKMVPNSVTVANAMPVAAEAARYHIGSCPDDAVADALFDIAESTRRGEMPSFMRQ